MADSGGTWVDLAEAQKLTQSVQVAGIVEEDIKNNNLITLLPIRQIAGLDVAWLREKTVGIAHDTDIGAQLIWESDQDYDKITRSLGISYKQNVLDHYVESVYGTFNNYRNIAQMSSKKAVWRFIGDRLLYGDPVNNDSKQATGLHHLAQLFPTPLNGSTNALNIDQGSAGLASSAICSSRKNSRRRSRLR